MIYEQISSILKEGIQQLVQSDDLTQSIQNNSGQVMSIVQQSLSGQKLRSRSVTVQADDTSSDSQIQMPESGFPPDTLLSKISDGTLGQMMKGIPEEYTDFLTEDISNLYEILKVSTSNLDELISKLTQEKINEMLAVIPTKFVDFRVKSVETILKDQKKQLKLNLVFNIKPIKPFVKFSLDVNGIKTELGRVVFQIKGGGKISDILVGHTEKTINVNLGSLFATFSISLKEIRMANRNVAGTVKGSIKELCSKDIMIMDLPKISVSYKNT